MSSVPLRLVLVRHGQVAVNARYALLGRRDDPLTPVGERQADELARHLAEVPVTAIYTSPLARAAATARRIARRHALEPIVEPRLVEQDYGQWEGLTGREIGELGAEARALYRRWSEDEECAPPGGESLAAVRRRVLDLVGELERQPRRGPVILVSHVGPIKTLICETLGVPLAVGSRRFFLDPGTASVIDWGRAPVLRTFNCGAGFAVR